MRVVVDTSVWVSALLWGGVPNEILYLARTQQLSIFASEELLQEIETSLNKRKLQRRIQQRGATAEYFLSVARALSQLCPTISVDVPELRDPKDLKILAAAVASNAEALITGDSDLLVLGEFQGIPILTPQAFLTRDFS